MNSTEPTGLPSLSPVNAAAAPPVGVISAPPVIPAPVASDARVVATDDKGLLSEDIACRSCGYNLRGLPPAGACPECMTAVARSIHGDYLQFSDPAWVDRLARGVKWIIIAMFAGVLNGVIMMIANIVSGAIQAGGNELLETIVRAIAISVSVLVAAAAIFGYWLVTSPDPASIDRERPMCLRNVARYGMIVSTLQTVLQALQQENMQAMMTPSATGAVSYTMAMAIGAATSLGLMVVGLVGTVAMFTWFRRLARRIPRQSLVWQTHVVMFGYMTSMLMMTVTQAILVIGGPGVLMPAGGAGMPVTFIVFGIISCGGLLLLMVFGIWALVLLFIYLSALRSAAAQARAGWARTA